MCTIKFMDHELSMIVSKYLDYLQLSNSINLYIGTGMLGHIFYLCWKDKRFCIFLTVNAIQLMNFEWDEAKRIANLRKYFHFCKKGY